MLRSLRTWLGLQITRLRFRKQRDPVISFAGSISSARHALLIMPFNRSHRFPAVTVMELLTSTYGEENITVITSEDDYQTPRLLPHSSQVRMFLNESNLLYLPRKSLLARIATREYDLAIDLNLDFVLPSAYICRASNARIRVGFVRKHSEPFYNMAIQTNPSLDRKDVYERLARCLKMF